eukprot:429781_1
MRRISTGNNSKFLHSKNKPFRCSCKTLLIATLTIWIFIFVVFFLYFHSSGSQNQNSLPFIENDVAIGSIKQEWIKDVKTKSSKSISKLEPIVSERMNIVSGFKEDDKLFNIAQRINLQLDKPKNARRIFEPIQLDDLSAYLQPREVYDVVKSQFKNANWQPK